MVEKKKTLFKEPKYKKYAKIISFKSLNEARISTSKILDEFGNAKTRAKELRLARVLQYASNRAMAMSKRKALSKAKKDDYKSISKIYNYGADILFEQYKELEKYK